MKKFLRIILISSLLLTPLFSLTACKGDDSSNNPPANEPEVQVPAVDPNANKLGAHYMVSDGLNDMAANGVIHTIDKKTSICYAVYLASEDKLGESDQLVKVSKFNVLQPTNAEWVTVFDKDKDFGGAKLSEASILNLNFDYVRVFAINLENLKYYYKDVNKKTLEVGELKEVKYKGSNVKNEPVVNLSKDDVNAHISDLGGTQFGHLQFGSNIVEVNRYFYATLCGGNNMNNIIFMESPDGETWTFLSMIEHKVNYEAVLSYHSDKFWIYCRNGFTEPSTQTNTNLLYSKDGKTWTESNLALTTSDTRPYLFTYQGELYLAYSSPLATDYSTVRTWRCNIHIGKIVSKDGVETYEEVIYKESKFGIVYYNVFDWYGKMILLYSSGELHPEEGIANWKSQGKDCMNYTVLHTVDPELNIQSNS